jgi:putative flippase GtrA
MVGWLAVGGGAFFFELGLITLMNQLWGWPLWIASLIAAELSILARFATIDRFVFGHPRPTVPRALKYHGASAGSFVVSWLVLNGSAQLLGVPVPVAALLGTVASFATSLPTNFLWVWRKRRVAALTDTGTQPA